MALDLILQLSACVEWDNGAHSKSLATPAAPMAAALNDAASDQPPAQ
jgi:hypothetical protein